MSGLIKDMLEDQDQEEQTMIPLPGRAIRRMSTWRVASAALFGEADLNAKKGRTPSTKVQGIRSFFSMQRAHDFAHDHSPAPKRRRLSAEILAELDGYFEASTPGGTPLSEFRLRTLGLLRLGPVSCAGLRLLPPSSSPNVRDVPPTLEIEDEGEDADEELAINSDSGAMPLAHALFTSDDNVIDADADDGYEDVDGMTPEVSEEEIGGGEAFQGDPRAPEAAGSDVRPTEPKSTWLNFFLRVATLGYAYSDHK